MKTAAHKIGRRPNAFSIICSAFLWIFCLLLIFLFVYAFFNSFKGLIEFIENPLGIPRTWSFDNYLLILNYFVYTVGARGPTYYIEDMILFTLIYCIGCTFCSIAVCTVTAYVTARFAYKFSEIVYVTVLVTMSLSVVGSQASELEILRSISLYDTFIGVFLLKANFLGVYFLVLHAMFKGVPRTYSEAAEIDGAGNLRIFWSIMLPLARNTLFTITLIYFIGYWNDYQTPLLYLPSSPTIALGLFNFNNSTIPDIASPTIKLGASFMVFLPIFIVFLIFQKRIIGNVSLGGIKE